MVDKHLHGVAADGQQVWSYNITSGAFGAEIISLGATLERLIVPAADGTGRDVLLGFDDVASRLERSDYQGVIVGQYANRLCGGEFSVGGKKYSVTKNEKGITCLHGGGEYTFAVWEGEVTGENSVAFTYLSPDMKEGFPGNVEVRVEYTLSEDGALSIDYSAVSDRDTIINLTNHAYFNLNGFKGGNVLGHIMKINADRYTPIDENSIPTGELLPVTGTPFSFLEAKEIGRDIQADDAQLKNGAGYDHNFCITDWDGTLRQAAVVYSPQSGIRLTVETTLPGIQLYTGNFLKGDAGKENYPMEYRTGFCLETQSYPDTPNNPSFPQCTYKAGERYCSKTVFRFDTV